MAKRRKKRASVGSVSDTLLKVAGVVAGQIGGGIVNNLISGKSTASTDTKAVYKSNLYVNLGETALGGVGAAYAPKGSFWEYLGIGLAADGAQRTVQSSMSGVSGTSLNRRAAAVGKYSGNGSGKLADTWEVV